MTSFTAQAAANGFTASTRLLGAERERADETIAQRLALAIGAPVWTIERLRLADERPMAVETSHLSAARFPQLSRHIRREQSLYAVLEKLDPALLEAAADLGCTRLRAFWRVTFPLSLPGVAAGALLCFIPIVGEFVIPDLLGGSQNVMIGQTLWTEFFQNKDWPVAAAVATVLLGLLLTPIVIYQQMQSPAGGR